MYVTNNKTIKQVIINMIIATGKKKSAPDFDWSARAWLEPNEFLLNSGAVFFGIGVVGGVKKFTDESLCDIITKIF